MDFWFSDEDCYNLIGKHKEKVTNYDDYMILFQDDDQYNFLSVSGYPGLKDDEILLSMGWADTDSLTDMFKDHEEKYPKDVKEVLDEHNLTSIAEYVKTYPLHAINDMVSHYGMIEFEKGYGDEYHKVKHADIEAFISQYLD